MKVYDAAHNLAKELKESPEFKELNELLKKINSEKDVKKMFEDIKTRQLEIQRAQIMGQPVEDEKKKKLEELFKIAVMNKNIAAYFQTEYKFAQMMDDVSKIISEAVEIKNA